MAVGSQRGGGGFGCDPPRRYLYIWMFLSSISSGFSVGLSCEDWRTSSHFGLESDPCPVGLGIRSVFPSAHVLILLYVSLGDMQQGGSGPVIRLLGFKFYPSCTI